MIRLYGHMRGSFRTVTQGLELAFQELGVWEGTHPGEGAELEDGIGGAEAPVAVVAGDPMRVLRTHYHGSHKERWVMLAPNSEGIPPQMREDLLGTARTPTGGRVPMVTGFLAPSSWAKRVLDREFPDNPVLLCPHGVLPEFRIDPAMHAMAGRHWEAGSFRILHVTSSRMSRKGTRELVRAWKRMAGDYPKAHLDILVNPEFLTEFIDLAETEKAPNTHIIPGQNHELSKYARQTQAYACVVQPSRAEGFGLVPLEARACGVPVVQTRCTGHATHPPGRGVVVVNHGIHSDSDDYPGSRAPTVTENDVYLALKCMLGNWEEIKQHAVADAPQIAREWSWAKQSENAVKQMKGRVL